MTSSSRPTAEEYSAFQRSTCLRDFSQQYFMLGAAEEAAEVFEAVLTQQGAAAILKECGDVLW
jgi:NTP pyrophosphatase (non-canonical NTP hydrolase)